MAVFPDQQRILGTPSHAIGDEGPGPRIMAADTLTGEKVVNQQGERLGQISHIMLDIFNGTIVYAVLSFGGHLGWVTSFSRCRGNLCRWMLTTNGSY